MNNRCWCTLNYPIVLYFIVFAYFAEEYCKKITWIKKDIESLFFFCKILFQKGVSHSKPRHYG